ncbi:MAG: tRNA-dihydrouridine synthase family protein [Akkermansia sp.]|nr:tRNA-dihydrouridine synthase family protein [Akkermansia sp.]
MKLILAPMQDVTDLAFMRTLKRIDSLPDLFITAYFRSTTTTCALAEHNLRCIDENETGVPVLAQLAGSDADALVRDATMLINRPGVAGINLNAGCPSPLVNRHGAGAGLLRDTPRFLHVMQALRACIPTGQFSVKCRLGWEDAETEFPDILECLATAEPDEVGIHARTRRQLYGGTPDFSYITQAVQALPCPVLANGDLNTPGQAADCLAATGAAGLMLGRGAVRYPYLFRQLRGGPAPTREDMITYYCILAEETGRVLLHKRTEKGHCNRMKKYLTFCYPDFTADQEYRLRRCTQVNEMLRILIAVQNR